MKTNHTPGPWKVVDRHIFTDEKDYQTIAYTDDHRNRQARPAKETEANAQLMAAAPELLEACQRVMQLAISAQGDEIFAEVRAAIAKATQKANQ
jgi:type VI protein secretion system component VasF